MMGPLGAFYFSLTKEVQGAMHCNGTSVVRKFCLTFEHLFMFLTLKPSGFCKDFRVFSSVHNIIWKYINDKNKLFTSLIYLIIFVHDKSFNVLNIVFFNRLSNPDKMNFLWYLVWTIWTWFIRKVIIKVRGPEKYCHICASELPHVLVLVVRLVLLVVCTFFPEHSFMVKC